MICKKIYLYIHTQPFSHFIFSNKNQCKLNEGIGCVWQCVYFGSGNLLSTFWLPDYWILSKYDSKTDNIHIKSSRIEFRFASIFLYFFSLSLSISLYFLVIVQYHFCGPHTFEWKKKNVHMQCTSQKCI